MSRFFSWLSRALGVRAAHHQLPASQLRQRYPRLYNSRLEDRRVLNAAPMMEPVAMLSLVLNAAEHADDGHADRFEIVRASSDSNSEFSVRINDRLYWHGQFNQIETIRFEGSSDEDLFVIDATLEFAHTVAIEGGGSSGLTVDQLVLINSDHRNFDEVLYGIADDSTNIQFGADGFFSSLAVSNVELIVDEIGTEQRQFKLDVSAGTWRLQGQDPLSIQVARNGQVLELGSDDSRFVFLAPTNSLIIDTRSLTTQTLNFGNLEASALTRLEIRGDSADTVHFGGHSRLGNSLTVNAGRIEIEGLLCGGDANFSFVASDAFSSSTHSEIENFGGTVRVEGTRIEHSGSLRVGGDGSVMLDAGMSGILQVRGIIEAIGDRDRSGGTIHLLGNEVNLLNGATIDASGPASGGTVLVGGDLHGNNPEVRNARMTFVAHGAIIRANAQLAGHGGTIVVWANETTIVSRAENLQARGGTLAGNGGVIETSGRQLLRIDGAVDASAEKGTSGQWLIDPEKIRIVASIPASPEALTTYLLAGDIVTALSAGINVTIETDSSVAGDGDIIVEAPISVSPSDPAILRLIADRDVIFTSSVSGNSNLRLSISADRDVNAQGVDLGTLGFLTIAATGDVQLDDVTVGTGAGNAGVSLQISANSILIDGTVESASGKILLTATQTSGNSIEVQGIDSNGGDIEFRGAAGIVFDGGANSIHSTGGNGSLIVRGTTTSTTIGLGNGALANVMLSDTSIAAIGSGFDGGIQFGATGQSGEITFAGTGHTYDQSVVVKADSGATVNILADVRTTENSAVGKSLQINGSSTSTINLQANLVTNGGDVTVSGDSLLVSGTSTRQITTSSSTAPGGDVDLSGLSSIDGLSSAAELEIDTRGTTAGGTVSLAAVRENHAGLNRLSIQTSSTTDGQVTLNDIRLIAKAGVAPTLSVNQADTTPTTIRAAGTIDLSTSQFGQSGGNVDFGSNSVGPAQASSTLTILTRSTNLTAGDDGSDGGQIILGGVGASGGHYLDAVTIDTSAADSNDAPGTIFFTGSSTIAVAVDGSSGGNASQVGIQLKGQVNNPFVATLTVQTNPASATGLNSLAIDLRQADFVTTANLLFDTSGANQSATAGHVLLGDLGTVLRPTSLIVDTRGTNSSGSIMLDDSDGSATETELHIDGSIDLSRATTELADATLMRTYGGGNILLLGSTVTSGGSRNLTLRSDSDITVSQINLSGGNLLAEVDRDGDDSGASFQSTGSLSIGTLTLYGSGVALDDILFIEGGANASSAIEFANWQDLNLLSDVSSGAGISVSDIAGSVVFGSNADLLTAGSIDLATLVPGIILQGDDGTTNAITATGATSFIRLAPVVSSDTHVNLTVTSDYSVILDTVDLQGGTLQVEFSKNTSLADSIATLETVQAGGLQIRGASRVNDMVVLTGAVTIGNDGILIENVNQLDVESNITANSSVAVRNILDRIQIAEAIAVESNGDLDLQTNVNSIVLSGKLSSINRIEAQGDSSTLRLANVVSPNGASLLLVSERDMSIQAIDLVSLATLSISFDGNQNTVGAQLQTKSLRAGLISIHGGTEKDDIAVIDGTADSLLGGLVITSVATIQFNEDVTSATSIVVNDVSGRVVVGSDVDITSQNGHTDMLTDVQQIEFVGGSTTHNSIVARQGDLFVADLYAENLGASIVLRSDLNVVLQSSQLQSSLSIVAGEGIGATGQISSLGIITAGRLDLIAETGVGGTQPLQTSSANIAAVNLINGNLEISNMHGSDVTVSQLVAHGGGNISFEQFGGGAVKLLDGQTLPDTSPSGTESNISLSIQEGNLTIAGLGVTAGGQGNVRYETLVSGNISLQSSTQAVDNFVAIESAGAIEGTGAIHASFAVFNATNGIGVITPLQSDVQVLIVRNQLGSIRIDNHSIGDAFLLSVETVLGGSVEFRQEGIGNLLVGSIQTGSSTDDSQSDSNDINLYNDNASLVIFGTIEAAGVGSIALIAAQDIILTPTSNLITHGAVASVDIQAGDLFQFSIGSTIQIGIDNSLSRTVITQLPPAFNASAVRNSLSSNVDYEGFATITIGFGSATPSVLDRNFGLVIDWNDGEVDQFPGGPRSSRTTDPGFISFDASTQTYAITHQYLGNPNVNDPTAQIEVLVTVTADRFDRLSISDDHGASANISRTIEFRLDVPVSGLFIPNLQLPQAPEVQQQFVFNREQPSSPVNTPLPVTKIEETPANSFTSASQQQRKYTLRVITPIDEEGHIESSDDIPLEESTINDLAELFRRLSDNRYRIYVLLPDGNELILRDFYLRNHMPFEVAENEVAQTFSAEDPVLDLK